MTNNKPRNVHKALERAGWYESRSVEERVLACVQKIERNFGFSCFPEALRILFQFGDLVISDCDDLLNQKCRLKIEIPDLIEEDSIESYQELEEVHGIRFYPLGELFTEHAEILTDEKGRIYLLDFNEVLWLAGNSLKEALTNLFQGNFGVML